MRVCVSVSCAPNRISLYLDSSLGGIANKTIPIDHVFVFVPTKPSRSKQDATLVYNADDIAAKYTKLVVTIVKSDIDRGPIEKFTGCVHMMPRSVMDTMVIVCDDDQIYAPKMIELMLSEYDRLTHVHKTPTDEPQSKCGFSRICKRL